MKQVCADTVSDAFWTFDPFALVGPEDPWYADLDAPFGRHRYGVLSQLRRSFLPSPTGASPDFVQVGLVGHKGSGKTTQVQRAMGELREHVFPVFVDAVAAFDQLDLTFADLLLEIARSVTQSLADEGYEIPVAERERVERWFSEELLTEVHRQQLLGGLEATAEGRVGVPFLAKLMAKVTAVLKSDNEWRREIRRRAEQDSRQLVERLNELLVSAAGALVKSGNARKLLVVVDNLEKLPDRRPVDAAVLRRADDLRRLKCHLLLFLDPADQYAPITRQASDAVRVVTLPMLPVRERADAPDDVAPEAVTAVRELFRKRAVLTAVFRDVAPAMEELTRFSGGRLRDALQLGRYACELAEPETISRQHIVTAARRLRSDKAPIVRPQEWLRLAVIHRDKQVANRPEDAHLLLHSLVLNYDGDPWWDVHPLVRMDEQFQQAWDKQAKARDGSA